jgi:hypothetical protein
MNFRKLLKARIVLIIIFTISIFCIIISFKTKSLEDIAFTHFSGDPTTKCTVVTVGITTVPNLFPTVLTYVTSNKSLPCVYMKTWYLTD